MGYLNTHRALGDPCRSRTRRRWSYQSSCGKVVAMPRRPRLVAEIEPIATRTVRGRHDQAIRNPSTLTAVRLIQRAGSPHSLGVLRRGFGESRLVMQT